MASLFQLIVALASLLLGFRLWHRAMPPVIAARGRLRAMATWAQGMALSIFGGLFLSAALADAPIMPLMLLAQLCLIASGIAHLRHTVTLGCERWSEPLNRKVLHK